MTWDEIMDCFRFVLHSMGHGRLLPRLWSLGREKQDGKCIYPGIKYEHEHKHEHG
jgi:hypothetical protein